MRSILRRALPTGSALSSVLVDGNERLLEGFGYTVKR